MTTIITQLSSKSASDWGVKTLKSGLLDSVKTRFAEMESEKHYTISTYLDPRYKMYYYRDTSTIDDVREIITEEILSQLVFSDIFEQTNSRGVVPVVVQT